MKGNDLTGSLIESDLPLAVFTGHMRAGIPEGFNNVESKGLAICCVVNTKEQARNIWNKYIK